MVLPLGIKISQRNNDLIVDLLTGAFVRFFLGYRFGYQGRDAELQFAVTAPMLRSAAGTITFLSADSSSRFSKGSPCREK